MCIRAPNNWMTVTHFLDLCVKSLRMSALLHLHLPFYAGL